MQDRAAAARFGSYGSRGRRPPARASDVVGPPPRPAPCGPCAVPRAPASAPCRREPDRLRPGELDTGVDRGVRGVVGPEERLRTVGPSHRGANAGAGPCCRV
jgi:hypothetical protein